MVRGGQGVATMKQANIVTPIQWVLGTFGIACLYFATRTVGLVQDVLVVIPILLVVLYILAYVYWTFVKPDRLQSEQFQLTQSYQHILERQGGFRISNPELLKTIPPPEPPEQRQLPGGEST